MSRFVSIHAPAWGATKSQALHYSHSGFQSTRPRGARLGQEYATSTSKPVSIHAPAWGATGGQVRHINCRVSFNPRARVGRDLRWWGLWRSRRRFNPRARVGRDVAGVVNVATRLGFNPRARVGRDLQLLLLYVPRSEVSIHAPAWGATVKGCHKTKRETVSIHAPAWGATRD